MTENLLENLKNKESWKCSGQSLFGKDSVLQFDSHNSYEHDTGVPYSVLVGWFYDELFKDAVNDLLWWHSSSYFVGK